MLYVIFHSTTTDPSLMSRREMNPNPVGVLPYLGIHRVLFTDRTVKACS